MNSQEPIVNIHIQQTSFKNESRVLKQTQSIIDSKLVNQIIIVAFKEASQPETQFIHPQIRVDRINTIIKFKPGKMNSLTRMLLMIEWLTRIFFKYKFSGIKIINCHSVELLLFGYCVKLLNPSIKFIYDTHELETEKDGISGLIKRMVQVIEKIAITKTDIVFVVSNGIKQWYENTYNIKNVYTVRNIPSIKQIELANTSTDNLFRKVFTIPEHALIFIFQGIFASGRHIPLLLECFSDNRIKNAHIVFMGDGPLKEMISTYSQKCQNIHIHPFVNPDKVIQYTLNADCGIALIEDTCLSYHYSLPNKFFEYLLSGIPVLVSNLPDMVDIVNKHNVGFIVNSNKEAIISTICGITKEEISLCKNSVTQFSNTINWDSEADNMIYAYKQLFIKK
jgi:glycosyltransferase involved in cell wall biosynthesis